MLDISEKYKKVKMDEIEKMNMRPKTYNGPAKEFLDAD
jgi:hypothetical protein